MPLAGITSLPPRLRYYAERGGVVFLSYCRFWEKHGFVQQSLAYELARAGILVTWLDGAGWRSYEPVVREKHPNLRVTQLPELPLRRFGPIARWDAARKARWIEAQCLRPNRPVIWVQGGIDEELAKLLPYVDVFSVFDDPYRHLPDGPLCRKARLVTVQNDFAYCYLKAGLGERLKRLAPPVELLPQSFRNDVAFALPTGFPERRLGYLGSFFSAGFDFDLVERFLTIAPTWGVVLVGRTDARGDARAKKLLERHRNFARFEWIPRESLTSLWRSIDLCFLPYRDHRAQDGAFAIKALEALHFGKPIVATRVPKTERLGEWFPLVGSAEEVIPAAEKALRSGNVAKALETLREEMDPIHHLETVAQAL